MKLKTLTQIILRVTVALAAAQGSFALGADSVQSPKPKEIRDYSRMYDAMPAFLDSDVIAFDLDNSVFASEQTFGSDKWFDTEVERLMNQGLDKKFALLEAQRIMDLGSVNSSHRAVEPRIPSIIKKLQAKGKTVFALTARRLEQQGETFRALNKIGVSFDSRAPHHPTSIDYVNGVVFSNGQAKGPVLKAFLREQGLNPKSISFVDDKKSNLDSVNETTRELGIRLYGIHYHGALSLLANYRQDVADLQHLSLIMGQPVPTDEEAIARLKLRKRLAALRASCSPRGFMSCPNVLGSTQ